MTTTDPLVDHVMSFDTAGRARSHLARRHPTAVVLRTLVDRSLDLRDLDALHVAAHKRTEEP